MLQATNVPFLGRGKQEAALAIHIARHFPDAKADLATAMLSRMINLATTGGTFGGGDARRIGYFSAPIKSSANKHAVAFDIGYSLPFSASTVSKARRLPARSKPLLTRVDHSFTPAPNSSV